jgi:NAD(P)-dependent dehydrogenase (short-subunit alcohol dehydrogenase family)
VTAAEDAERPLPPEARGEAPGRGRLRGRRILIVGAGTNTRGDPQAPVGNGQAIARLAAREGAEVVCADLDERAAEVTAAAVREDDGVATVVQGDVEDVATCARLVTDAGRLNGVVCNVGIGRGQGLSNTTPDDWDAVLSVNLRSHFLLARTAVPLLPAGGSLVFIGSVAGLVPGTGIPAYDASKAALLGLSRAVATEAGRAGIRANVVVPGLMDTPIGREASSGRPNRTRAPVVLGRQGTAWEVAYAAVFLLSDEASYVTGQKLVVDGGLSWT